MSGAATEGVDDAVLPFAVESLDLRGRAVRLGATAHAIIDRHGYPPPVARLLGEAMALTVLLGSSLKDATRFQVQTRTNGPVDLVVVDFDAPGDLRAYARFDDVRLKTAMARGEDDGAALLGHGHLAMTVEHGASAARYQGVVALDGRGLEAAAHVYFQQSEQIPTRIRLAVGETVEGDGEAGLRPVYRIGGVLAQFLPAAPERARQADFPPGDAPADHVPHAVAEDEAWTLGRALVETVEDHELIDPTLSSERLLYRLFHEQGVRVFPAHAVTERCTCSRDRILKMLRGFDLEERRAMVADDGSVTVTCEFCSRRYPLTTMEIGLGLAVSDSPLPGSA